MQPPAPTRDAAEGAGEAFTLQTPMTNFATLKRQTFDPKDAGFTLADCGCREHECEGRTDGTCHHPVLDAAPPKPAPVPWPQDAPPLLHPELLGPDGMGTPSEADLRRAFGVEQPAPDAVRKAMKVTDHDREYAKNLLDDLGDDGIEDSEIVAQWFRKVRVETMRSSAPVPPTDGVGETEQQFEDRLHKEDDRDMLRLLDHIADKIGLPHNEELSRDNFNAWLATPSVRGDREILQRIAEFCSDDANALGAIKRLAEIQRLAHDALSLPVQPGAGERK